MRLGQIPALPLTLGSLFVVTALAIVHMPAWISANAQVFVDEGHCITVPIAGCENCNAPFPPTWGCTAPPPSTWNLGICDELAPIVCFQRVNYNCGEVVRCGDGFFPGLLCNTNVALCKN